MAQVLFGFILLSATLRVHVECADIKEKNSTNITPTRILNQYTVTTKASEEYHIDSSAIQSVTELKNHAEVSTFSSSVKTKETAVTQAAIVAPPSTEIISEDGSPSKVSVTVHYSSPVKRTGSFGFKLVSQNSKSSSTAYTMFLDTNSQPATISNEEKPVNYLSEQVTDDPRLGQARSSVKRFIANVSPSLAPDIYERSSATPAAVDIAQCDDCSTSQHTTPVSTIVPSATVYDSDTRKFSKDSVYTRLQIGNTTPSSSSVATTTITNEYMENETTLATITASTTTVATNATSVGLLKSETQTAASVTHWLGHVSTGGRHVSNVIEQPINVSQLAEFTESDVSLMFNGQQVTTTASSVTGSAVGVNASGGLWPVKHSAVVEGDLVLGGLMMVHEREDSITCGPVMPQGGIQALEAMLYTLDMINQNPTILPNVTLGAHILDDCDKDTYGLEMAVDFIKGK